MNLTRVLVILMVVMGASALDGAATASPCREGSADDLIIDQANDECRISGGSNIRSNAPLGQEFTPAFDHLDAIDLYIGDTYYLHDDPGATFRVKVHTATITGATVGTSDVLDLPDDYDAPARFIFPRLVPLIPGTVYVIEIVQLSGPDWFLESNPSNTNPYPGGRWIVSGQPVEMADTWFRVGILRTPVRESTWGHIKGLFLTP